MAENEKPQVGEYFVCDSGPMLRINEVYSPKVKAWFVKADDGVRYLIIKDETQGVWVALMKIERGNF